MSQLTVDQLSKLTTDEAEAFAKGILTKTQVLKRAQNRRYHAKHGRVFGPVNKQETVTVQLKTPEPTRAEKKAAYIKAWRAKNRVKLAAKARAKYRAQKNGTWAKHFTQPKTSTGLPDAMVKAGKGSPEFREARAKRLKLEYQRTWRAKNRAKVNADKRAAYARTTKPGLEARIEAIEQSIKGRTLLQRLVGNLFDI